MATQRKLVIKYTTHFSTSRSTNDADNKDIASKNVTYNDDDNNDANCNGAPVACTVTVQATYTEHRVRWCLETPRIRVVQRKVSTREKWVKVELYLVKLISCQ